MPTGKELAYFTHKSRVQSATFSPDNTKIVTVSNDKTARIWDITTQKELARFAHDSYVQTATFSPDGTKIVTVSLDRTVRGWDLMTGKELAHFTHKSSVQSAAFSPDNTKIVTTSNDGTARVWIMTTRNELARFTDGGSTQSAALNPNGTSVVSAFHNGTARLWDDVMTEDTWPRFFRHEKLGWSAAFCLDGTRVVTASADSVIGTIRILDVLTGKELLRFIYKNLVEPVTFRDTAETWQALEGSDSIPLAPNGSVTAFSQDGTQLVTASRDNTARVWDVATGKELTRFTHNDSVYSAAFTLDNTRVLTISADETARVWDIHWLTQYHGQELIERVCREKLIGASHITKRDIEISPILTGREGEDVCDPPSWFSRLTKSLGFSSKPTGNSK